MARERLSAAAVSERQRRTQELFLELESSTDPGERRDLVDALAQLNLPLGDALASRYTGRGCERDDLVQVARVGLLLAIERFRPGEGRSFAGFAVPTIDGELKRHFRDHCWTVRPPRRIQEMRPKVAASRAELAQELNREPSVQEMAMRLEEDPGQVRACLGAGSAFRPLSLEGASRGDSGISLGETLPSGADDVEALLDRVDVRRAVAALPERDRRVVCWRFVDGLSQARIAARLGISQVQVSRILRRVLGNLRRSLDEAGPHAA